MLGYNSTWKNKIIERERKKRGGGKKYLKNTEHRCLYVEYSGKKQYREHHQCIRPKADKIYPKKKEKMKKRIVELGGCHEMCIFTESS